MLSDASCGAVLREPEKVDLPRRGDAKPVGSALLDVWSLGSTQLDAVAAEAFHQLEAHIRHGRDGFAWCRWAVQALDSGTFLVADARSVDGGWALDAIIALTADTFCTSCPLHTGAPPDGAPRDTLTVLLRKDIPRAEAEDVLQRQRPTLLRRGLMAGLLHPESTLRPLTPGPEGMPYRVGWPFLTLRWAVADDEGFVGINPELRALLKAWMDAIGN